ncbi:3-deoxy-D-manno-octulosonic acid kinase [Marinobacter daqiaonensis]|uniref:3-deoxy-D-manno-octulosonic acid kinase n=1 Tax=Marinobacter daqiaonensis TaxID=650891 RepID=A0A1I6K208_9GAMM|nr:3-deoxy-D-manno-octulosonic acid kinase [Marinobacter daqiaonensis]SFR85251.1 3-deoxy-D-manno-octulosonic acid kinase [Marinobacter daqiaonensis]
MLVVSPGYEQVTEAWFEPEFWGDRASAVSSGGRGSAWFVHSEVGDLVLRHYRRGGLMARMSDRSYVYTGMERTRSLREFRLLSTLYERGLPVPEPVAAWSGHYHGLWYHSAILLARIANAITLPEVPDLTDRSLWSNVGKTIRRFHDQGLDHVDLNCDNLLIADGKVYLIDFDRCRLRSTSGGQNWKSRNLNRLKRSVDKRCSRLPEQQRESLWQDLLKSYG